MALALRPTFLVLMVLAVGPAFAQDSADQGLLAEINRIRAVDNHMHGDAVTASRTGRWQADNPLGKSRYPEVVALQPTNPEWRTAWYALYGYGFPDGEPAHLKALLVTKRETMTNAGANWPSIVLDNAGVDIALLNMVEPGIGQTNGRFRWVPYADPLLRPFVGESSWLEYSGGELSIDRLLKQVGFSHPPPTLTEYRVNIINALLARWKANGAVAVKFLCAYARSLDFQPVEEGAAAAVYLKAVKNPESLSAAEHKLLEDYLFGAVAAAAGEQKLAVQIHTGNGDGPFFDNQHANPGLLESALDSRALRKTNFVLLHGGWPWQQVTQAMIDKPNTYADFSAQTLHLGTHQLAVVLRDWLSWHPEKVLFGSDAYSDADSPLTGWEEKEILASGKARRALAIALTAMMQNGEISRERALEIARGVLRENAIRLYSLASASPQ